MEKKGTILHIHGKVQGVGFRYYTHKKANELGVKGFVKNLPDGSVYVEAESGAEILEQFVNWCQEGPSWARVSKVDRQDCPVNGYPDFTVR